MRAIVGHLARAGVIQPAPSPMDRVRGRVVGELRRRARARRRGRRRPRGSARAGSQYRAVVGVRRGHGCRRAAILQPLRRPGAARRPSVPCCDVCDPSLVPAAPARAVAGGAAASRAPGPPGTIIDEAILAVVRRAEPSVGRTRVAEILRGGQAKALLRNS